MRTTTGWPRARMTAFALPFGGVFDLEVGMALSWVLVDCSS